MKQFLSIIIVAFLFCSCTRQSTSNMKISLAEWSLHRALQSNKMTNLDFPRVAKTQYNIDAIEYVSIFFDNKAEDTTYLSQLKAECTKYGVKSVLIMVDGEGNLGDTNAIARQKAVENHYKWVSAAKFLGCHSIRVNAAGDGDSAQVKIAAIDGLSKLAKYAAEFKINVIVENHWGYSSQGNWLSDVMKKADQPNLGTLPDFGNFDTYDRYQGVADMMPFAKGVSAKSYNFDANGNETKIDYPRMIKILIDNNYSGYIGIEYEGDVLSEEYGIKATIALLNKL
jgi:sugar phosphate isomerase/epimerase